MNDINMAQIENAENPGDISTEHETDSSSDKKLPYYAGNIEHMPLDSIIPYARNPRVNSQAVPKVMASLKEFGPQQPIVVDTENVIIVGHTRYEAARQLGWTHFPVLVARSLTAAQIKAYRLADNRTADYSQWDNALLKIEFEELNDLEFDLELTAFDENELARLLSDDESQPPEDFKEYNESIETEHQCPSCGYVWSGSSKVTDTSNE